MSVWLYCSLVQAWLTDFIAFLTSKWAVQTDETIQLYSPQHVVPQGVLLEASKGSTTYYWVRMIKTDIKLCQFTLNNHIIAKNKCYLSRISETK